MKKYKKIVLIFSFLMIAFCCFEESVFADNITTIVTKRGYTITEGSMSSLMSKDVDTMSYSYHGIQLYSGVGAHSYPTLYIQEHDGNIAIYCKDSDANGYANIKPTDFMMKTKLIKEQHSRMVQ